MFQQFGIRSEFYSPFLSLTVQEATFKSKLYECKFFYEKNVLKNSHIVKTWFQKNVVFYPRSTSSSLSFFFKCQIIFLFIDKLRKRTKIKIAFRIHLADQEFNNFSYLLLFLTKVVVFLFFLFEAHMFFFIVFTFFKFRFFLKSNLFFSLSLATWD
jgi:hypothetical protein